MSTKQTIRIGKTNKWANYFLILESINPVSHAAYVKLNAKIEFLSEIMYLLTVRLSMPGTSLPALLITLVNYFINDLGEESFYLPFLVVYALEMHTMVMCVWF